MTLSYVHQTHLDIKLNFRGELFLAGGRCDFLKMGAELKFKKVRQLIVS